MKVWTGKLLWVWLLTALISCGTNSTERPGFVEGHVSIGPLVPVERIGVPTPTVSPQVYAAYPIIIFAADGQTQVTRIEVDGQGSYRIALAAGQYVINIAGRASIGGAKNLPRPITIVSDQTVRVDIDIDTGIR